ncbi:hypothetical protein M5D96_001857 [Drosophila gunungcola]|uniref:Uncharacterized protein n=1 Tax=Drosophila gunungcola TaxID=103775 RepID=A0A9P9YZQ8_9MUSC|nr:hypothetical protein M5D96_001857 [Drosophila gunungcola]
MLSAVECDYPAMVPFAEQLHLSSLRMRPVADSRTLQECKLAKQAALVMTKDSVSSTHAK